MLDLNSCAFDSNCIKCESLTEEVINQLLKFVDEEKLNPKINKYGLKVLRCDKIKNTDFEYLLKQSPNNYYMVICPNGHYIFITGDAKGCVGLINSYIENQNIK